uniref:Uncharacterized protein n=1 Tax=Rhodnius prolixus TaxID=13249 RepID=T1HYI6_RHOPR
MLRNYSNMSSPQNNRKKSLPNNTSTLYYSYSRNLFHFTPRIRILRIQIYY